MQNTINLDPIIRKLNGQTPIVAGEEVLVTIDLITQRAIEKTLLVRWGGNFQDYLVANNRNPTRTAGGKTSTYVRDADNERTLALEISVTASCPDHSEVKIAEALFGEQTPSQAFTNLLERWVREFIRLGDEGRFIDTYDVARLNLENHIAARAKAQTGLELRVKVALSAESDVLREIVVGPIELGVRLHDYKGEQNITVEAGLALDTQNYVKAFVYQERREAPEELFKRHLREYFSQAVTFQQFTHELQYAHFKQPLQQALSATLKQIGRRLSFINFSSSQGNTVRPPREFVAVSYDHSHEIPGRPQSVDITNTVQLYCENSLAFIASGVTDLESWTRSSLEVVLKRHLIGKTYVDLLLRFGPLEQLIKRELSSRAALIGYKVDHLVSIPNLKEWELTEPFLLELDDTFETQLDTFEVQLKFSIKLRIPNLQSIEKYLNFGTDVKDAIREVILSEARQCLRNIHPERFYLYFNHPAEAATADSLTEDDRMAVKDLLSKKIAESLTAKFDAEISYLTPRVGRSELTERYNNLCYVIRQFRVNIESTDPQGAESLTLTGNFEVRGVHSDSAGWQRFSALRLDLDGLQIQLEAHLRAELKPYYQSSFMFQNRSGREQVFELVKEYAHLYMRQEFGLIVHLTNLDRNTTGVEEKQRQLLVDLENEKLASIAEQGQRLVTHLNELRTKRVRLLSIFPVDKETLQETDESIRILQGELDSITAARFGQHQLAATLENQHPDQLPPRGGVVDVAIPDELESGPKHRLAD
jgi:hypothetical protein